MSDLLKTGSLLASKERLVLAESPRSGTPHKRGFLCTGNDRSWPYLLVHNNTNSWLCELNEWQVSGPSRSFQQE